MFIQGIAGRVADAEAFKRLMDQWLVELRPSSPGWLGHTGGVTDDGRFVITVRFESEAAKDAISNRPEQDAWWNEFAKTLDGDADFIDAPDAIVYGDPGRFESAGFVQVIRARCSDVARAKALTGEFERLMPGIRPDVLGGTTAISPDGRTQETIYFTSEAEARAGEAAEPSDEARALMQSYFSLMSDTEWFDLREPLMA